jgi:hypothetical protein
VVYDPVVNDTLPSVIVTAEDIEATKKDMLAKESTDVAIRLAETGGPRVGVSLVYRPKGDGNPPVVHHYVSEVYQILEGSGTLVTGGTMLGRNETGGERRQWTGHEWQGPPYGIHLKEGER